MKLTSHTLFPISQHISSQAEEDNKERRHSHTIMSLTETSSPPQFPSPILTGKMPLTSISKCLHTSTALTELWSYMIYFWVKQNYFVGNNKRHDLIFFLPGFGLLMKSIYVCIHMSNLSLEFETSSRQISRQIVKKLHVKGIRLITQHF